MLSAYIKLQHKKQIRSIIWSRDLIYTAAPPPRLHPPHHSHLHSSLWFSLSSLPLHPYRQCFMHHLRSTSHHVTKIDVSNTHTWQIFCNHRSGPSKKIERRQHSWDVCIYFFFVLIWSFISETCSWATEESNIAAKWGIVKCCELSQHTVIIQKKNWIITVRENLILLQLQSMWYGILDYLQF